LGKGLSKIMSKMGVSTYMSYCGAQLFEAIGLSSETIAKYFTGTPSRVEGIGVFDIAEEAIRMHKAAFSNDPVLANMHWTPVENTPGAPVAKSICGRPDAIAKLQHSTRANNWNTYKEYAQMINDQSKRHMTLRGLFEFKIDPPRLFRWSKSSRPKTLSSDLPRAPCRSALSVPKPMPRWLWP
jgi:glutamate synthase (NADPH/NADH) large chain